MRKKTNLEKKILKKIYFWELKRTTIDWLLKISSFLIVGLFFYIFIDIFFEILSAQKSFDLFAFFTEDFEVIKKYFFENILIFLFEIPKTILLLILVFGLIFTFISIKLIKNWRVYQNKIKSFLKFFKNL